MTKMKVLRFKRDFLLLVFLAITFCATAFAGGGKITGKVTEKKTGEPALAASIVLTHVLQDGKETQLPVQMGATTDVNGYYVILNVPPGEYTIKTSSIGFSTVITKGVKVDPDRTIKLDLVLEESTIGLNEIVVTAKQEVIKADVSGTQEIISADKISVLPIVRVDEYFGKLKGVQLSSSSDGYGLVIRGGAIRETDIRLDGSSLQDPRSGNSYLGFNSTSINEIQLITGGFQAKYGGIRSGLLDVKTKDGSRERYTASIKADFTPKNQFRFFGKNPYDIIYDVYTGKYAWTGVPLDSTGLPADKSIPEDFKDFKGWKKTTTPNPLSAFDTLQREQLWMLQHPRRDVAQKPDISLEGTFTGPFIIPNTTFMAGFKYEDDQYAFPIGPRDDYVEWNTQLKLTSTFDKFKISVNGMYAKVFSNAAGQSVSYDAAQRFAYLNNNTPDAVNRQMSMVAGINIFNDSRVQEFEQTYGMGGIHMTYVQNPKLFYTLDFQVGYTGQDITPMLMDMSKDSTENYIYMYSKSSKKWYQFYKPGVGLPGGTTNPTTDAISKFLVYGGEQWADSSYSYNYQLKGDLTWQANPYNEVQAGFSVNLQKINVYAGSWNQSSLLFIPSSWQYYKASPLEIGFFVQDKLEFEGLIMNAGVRVDYFNPLKDGYEVGFPLDKDYVKLFTSVYSGLGGSVNSYERWLLFRDLLDDPPGWPSTDNKGQVKLSPRLGVSYPITENSKMYFNYGHFYQRPSASLLYNMKLNGASTTIPSPDLDMARTVQYEFGYEQTFLENFLVNVTAYYKDVSNEPALRTYLDYYETNAVLKYYPDAYKDIRGVELRLERNSGRYVMFSAMYDYMVTSSGTSGISTYYENLVKYRENLTRSAEQTSPVPQPRANINLTLFTPADFGMLYGGWYANFFFEWRGGGRTLLNPTAQKADQKWVDNVNWWNIDMRVSKNIDFGITNVEISLTVKNLTDNKWLNTSNFTTRQISDYRDALMSHNDAKWGDYDQDYLKKVFENSWECALFQNPRRVILGARINL
jgi:hypothetical protein